MQLLRIVLIISLYILFLPANSKAGTGRDTTRTDDGIIVFKGRKTLYYDQQFRLQTTYRHETFFTRGSQKEYDTLGRVTARGRMLMRHQHGRWMELKDGKKTHVRYRYGLPKTKFYTDKNKRIPVYLYYGMMAYSYYDSRKNIYKVAAAGCVVSTKTRVYCGVHNGFTSFSYFIRHGKQMNI